MDRIRLTTLFTFGAAMCFLPLLAHAQTPPRPSPIPLAQTSAAAVPIARIAVIYSGDFQDPKTGIARFSALLNKLNAEFKKQQDDLNASALKLRQLQAEVTNLQNSPSPNPALLQTKSAQFQLDK